MIIILQIEEENGIRIVIMILLIVMLPILLVTATAATTITTTTNLVHPRVINIVHGSILCSHIVDKFLYYASTILSRITRLPIRILRVVRSIAVSCVIADEQCITLHPRSGSIPRRP